MSRALDDLSSDLKPLAMELLARLTERGIMVLIVDTLRTAAEHEANLKSGASKTRLSRHLPRHLRRPMMDPNDPEFDKSDAMDVCPFETYALHGPDKLQWNPADPAWKIIGLQAERLGLIWGGRWQNPHDPGHVELPRGVWDR